jgi:hypothetical protein
VTESGKTRDQGGDTGGRGALRHRAGVDGFLIEAPASNAAVSGIAGSACAMSVVSTRTAERVIDAVAGNVIARELRIWQEVRLRPIPITVPEERPANTSCSDSASILICRNDACSSVLI